MLVASYVNIKPNMAQDRTYEDFYKFLGARPHMMGVMSRLYANNTASFLTEGLMNVFYNEKSVNKFQPINSMMFEWENEIEFVKRVQFAAVPSGTGSNGSDITFYFRERYFEVNDVFKIDGSRQQCIVKTTPQRKADNFWECVAQLVDADFSSVLDTNYTQVGMTARFLSNIQPEFHSEGFVKYQSKICCSLAA